MGATAPVKRTPPQPLTSAAPNKRKRRSRMEEGRKRKRLFSQFLCSGLSWKRRSKPYRVQPAAQVLLERRSLWRFPLAALTRKRQAVIQGRVGLLRLRGRGRIGRAETRWDKMGQARRPELRGGEMLREEAR